MEVIDRAIEVMKSFVDWKGVGTEVVALLIGTVLLSAWARSKGWFRRRREPTRGLVVPSVAKPPATTETLTWADRNSAALPMISALADMRAHLGALDGVDPGSKRRLGDSTKSSSRAMALNAHASIRKQGDSSALLLPDPLARRWHDVVQLLDEYRRGATPGPDRWPSHLLNRAQTDVDNYIVYLTKSLGDYISTGTVTRDCEPPILRRDDMESWQPC